MPATARAAQSLPRVDYADAFEVAIPAGARLDARRWARAVFDTRSPATGPLLRAIGLGLGAAPATPGSAVAVMRTGSRIWGFNVTEPAHDLARLEMLTWLGLVQIVVSVESRPSPERLTMSTFIAYSGRGGREAFTRLVGPAHRRVVPFLLAHAAGTAA